MRQPILKQVHCVFGTVLLLSTVVGCTVDQKKEVSIYRKVLDGKNPPAAEVDFDSKPLSLEDALILANRRNEQLATQGETYVQSLIARDRAFSAFLPTISLAPQVSYVDKRSSGSLGNITKQALADVPVTGGVTLFNGFTNAANLTSSTFTVEQRKAQLLDLQQTIFLEVAQTYYQILSSERSVLVLTNSVAVQDARVEDEQDRNRAGVARPLDVAQSEAQAAASRASLVSARQQVQNSRTMLAFLIDAPVENAVLVDRLEVPAKLNDLDLLLHGAREDRQDVQAARKAVEAARQQVTAALGQYYPSVTLNVDYYLHRESFPTLSEWSGVLQANLPLFDAGIIYEDVRNAWSLLRQARLNEMQTVRTVDEQVKTAYDNISASRHRIAELVTEVKASRDALFQAQQSYQAGLATNLDVLTAQDSLLTAQLSLAAEQFNYKVYYLNLERAMGQLLRPRELIPATMPSVPTDFEVTTPGSTRRTRAATGPAASPDQGAATPPNPSSPPATSPAEPMPK